MRTYRRVLGAVVAISAAAVAVPLLPSPQAEAARFSGGNLVVYRVGSGSGALSNAASPVFLDEYTAAGNKIQEIALPTTAADGNQPLTATGQSRSEGLISRSEDGKYLAVTGYAAAPGTDGGAAVGGGRLSLTASAPASVARVVGLVDSNGTVDTSTALSTAASPKIIRSAVTDGDRIYATGGNGGILTTTLGSSSLTSLAGAASDNLSGLTIQGGQLFVSGIVNHRIAKVGAGLPTSSATLTDLPTGSTDLPSNLLAYGYAFLDLVPASGWSGSDVDTLYLANASDQGGTVDKYRFDGSHWTLAGSADVPGVSGLVAHVNGGAVDLAVTTTPVQLATSTPSKLLLLTDPSGSSSSFSPGAPTTLATAGANQEFRGVALAPTGTTGPSVFVRGPATGATITIGSSGLTVSALAKSASNGAAISAVTVTVGSTTVTATKSGNVYSATVPAASLTSGAATIAVKATSSDGTTTVNRSVTLVPSGFLTAGTYAPSSKNIKHTGAWKKYTTASSPNNKGLVSSTKKDAVTTTVYGSKLTLVFDRTNKSGQVQVVVDGVKTTIDLYSAKAKVLKKTLKLGSLDYHTVSITVLGKKKAASKGTAVNLAAVQVKS